MNLDQAIQLALTINASSRATLISLGRYIASDQIQPDSPWGCCVRITGTDKPLIVWSLSEFTALFASPSPPKPTALLAPEPQPRRDAEHMRQPTLF